MRFAKACLALALLFGLANAATKPAPVVRFHPITQAQYDELLKLSNGEKAASEARLIDSGIKAISGLTTGIKTGFAAGVLPTVYSYFGGTTNNNNKVKQYPLCVVSDNDNDLYRDVRYEQKSVSFSLNNENDDRDKENEAEYELDDRRRHRYPNRGNRHRYPDRDHPDNDEDAVDDAHRPPIVNCVVVVSNVDSEGNTEQPPIDPPPPSPPVHPYPIPPSYPPHPPTHPRPPVHPPVYPPHPPTHPWPPIYPPVYPPHPPTHPRPPVHPPVYKPTYPNKLPSWAYKYPSYASYSDDYPRYQYQLDDEDIQHYPHAGYDDDDGSQYYHGYYIYNPFDKYQ